MKPVLICLLCCTGIYHSGMAQQTSFGAMQGPPMAMPATIFLTDIQGKRSTEEWNRHEIKGTPFFIPNWAKAVITLADNRRFNNISIRLNCVNNSIHYLNAQQEEMVAPDGVIKELLLLDSQATFTKEYILVSGFPAIDKHTLNTFYERQINGTVQLLMYTKKRLMELRTMGSAAPEKEYMGVESFYLYKDGQIRSWEKGKDFLLDLLSDKKEAVEGYIKQNNLKCKSIEDCRAVVSYYNTLQ
ncbi:MAG: hypothetical protein J7578_01715 [Chitinophagaceae bacterium]|nr:hypothetical protein [Chitinophagaceae bacterium]